MNIIDLKIVGLAKGHKSPNSQHADMYPLGYMDQFHKFILFEEAKKKEIFPPTGKIFAFNFKTYNTQYLDKFITFYVQEDINYDENEFGKHKYRLDTSSPIELFGITIINNPNLRITNDGQENRIELSKNGYDREESYVQSGENLYRIFLQENSAYIQYWKVSSVLFHENTNTIYILEEEKVIYGQIKAKPEYIDIITNEELRKFFESAIKRKYPEFLETLTKQKEWKEIFSENLNIKQLPETIVSNRLKKIQNILNHLLLSKEALDTLYADERFKETIQASITELEDQYLLLIKKKNKAKVKDILDQTDQETKTILKEYDSVKSQLNTQIEELDKKKNQLEITINRLEEKNKEEQEKYDNLQKIVKKNKQQLIDDFTIIKEVLNQSEAKQVSSLPDSYIIEEILPTSSLLPATIEKEWKERLDYYLCQTTDKAIRVATFMDLVAYHKIIMVPHINHILPLFKSINNAKYIVQNVGVDWKNFSCLWQNGLQALWISCRQHPSVVHFMVLQNMNLSYLPCYMQPLNDLLSGLRTRLPYSDGAPGFPDNLRIIGTTVSGNGGLPIYEKDIYQYGCMPDSEKCRDNKDTSQQEPVDKYITLELIDKIAESVDPESNTSYYVSRE